MLRVMSGHTEIGHKLLLERQHLRIAAQPNDSSKSLASAQWLWGPPPPPPSSHFVHRPERASAGPAAGRLAALQMARQARSWTRTASRRMPEATGDIREIVGQPVFVPLYKLFLTYGKIFRLSFGPKSFVVISDAAMAKQARRLAPCRRFHHCSCY